MSPPGEQIQQILLQHSFPLRLLVSEAVPLLYLAKPWAPASTSSYKPYNIFLLTLHGRSNLCSKLAVYLDDLKFLEKLMTSPTFNPTSPATNSAHRKRIFIEIQKNLKGVGPPSLGLVARSRGKWSHTMWEEAKEKLLGNALLTPLRKRVCQSNYTWLDGCCWTKYILHAREGLPFRRWIPTWWPNSRCCWCR